MSTIFLRFYQFTEEEFNGTCSIDFNGVRYEEEDTSERKYFHTIDGEMLVDVFLSYTYSEDVKDTISITFTRSDDFVILCPACAMLFTR